MSKLFSVLVFLFSVFLMFGCTRNDAQRDFEKEAYSLPNNFTETNNQGAIQNVDEDDWRTSPLFQGLVEVLPPYPNPVTIGQSEIRVEVDVKFGSNSVNGIQVVTFIDEVNRERLYLYQDFETLPNGLYVFEIQPSHFSESVGIEGARGLHRIYIFDGNNRMITYGDIRID